MEAWGALRGRRAGAEAPAHRDCAFWNRLAHRRVAVGTLGAITGDRVRPGRRERRHALLGTVSIGIAAWHAEDQAVEIIGARPGDASAKPLVGGCDEAPISVGAVERTGAREAPIHANTVLAREPRDAIVGIGAARLASKTAPDLGVTGIGGISAVGVVLARAAPDGEAPGVILAAGRQADLADRARVAFVAERLGIGTCGAQRRSRAPGASAVEHTTIGAGIQRGVRLGASVSADRAVRASVVRNGCVAHQVRGDRRRHGFTATGRDRSSQHDVSKGAHGLEAGKGGAPARATRVTSIGGGRTRTARGLTGRVCRPKGEACPRSNRR